MNQTRSAARFALVVVAVLIVLLSAVSMARATITPYQFRTAMDVAKATFPGSPCEGRVHLEAGLPSLAAFDGSLDLDLQHTGTHVGGLAVMDGSCRILIVADLEQNAAMWCTVLVHEYGHLSGLGHTEGTVMRREASEEFPPCAAMLPTVMPGEARRETVQVMSQQFPVTDGSMRIVCKRRSRLTEVCWARWLMADTHKWTGWFAAIVWRQIGVGAPLYVKTRGDLNLTTRPGAGVPS